MKCVWEEPHPRKISALPTVHISLLSLLQDVS